MRLLLDKSSKSKLFLSLKEKYNSNSILDLAEKLKVPPKTLEGWIYNKDRYVPDRVVYSVNPNTLKILDSKEEGWGSKKGGRESYKSALKKYGKRGVKKIQSKGGRRASAIKEKLNKEKFKLDIENEEFLEIYGALIGDGWLSNFKSNGKKVWIIGICANLRLERESLMNYSKIVNKKFDRKGTFRERLDQNTIEFTFSHKQLLLHLNKKLKFPIGKKRNITLPEKIFSMEFDKIKYVIRGIFDTDGSLYLDKNKKGVKNYPVISIHLNQPKLLEQLRGKLSERGFKVNHDKNNNMIKIKGRNQLRLWFDLIGSSNKYKRDKMVKALKNNSF